MHFLDFSMTLNQISMTKLKYRYKYEQFRTFCVLRADAGLHYDRLSLKNIFIIFKLQFSFQIQTQISMTFPKLL